MLSVEVLLRGLVESTNFCRSPALAFGFLCSVVKERVGLVEPHVVADGGDPVPCSGGTNATLPGGPEVLRGEEETYPPRGCDVNLGSRAPVTPTGGAAVGGLVILARLQECVGRTPPGPPPPTTARAGRRPR